MLVLDVPDEHVLIRCLVLIGFCVRGRIFYTIVSNSDTLDVDCL